jgi:RHS repeat-associated protein
LLVRGEGTVAEKAYYLPWGGTRGDETITSTAYAYTGQTREGDIYYYGARWYDPSIGRFMQADTIVPLQVQGTQAFDRYAYVNNNPLRYVDPGGEFAITTAILIGAGVGALIGYVGQVIHNLNEDMSFQDALTTDISAGWIIGGAVAGGVLGGAGFAALSHFGIISTASAATTATSGLCADGDCGNEISGSYGALSKAADYGIDTCNKLRNVVKGSGLQVHHLIEKRFTGILGLTPEQIKNMPSVVLTREEHQVFTNAWRQLIGYSNSVYPIKTTTATISDLIEAVNAIYEKYPTLLNESLRYLLPK